MEKYQTVLQRFAAIVFDTAIFTVIIYVYEHFFLDKRASETIAVVWSLVTLVSVTFYNIYLTYRYGQTFGKMLLRVKVVDISEEPLTLYQAILRRLIEFIFHAISTLITICLVFIYGLDANISSSVTFRYLTYFYLSIMLVQMIVTLLNQKHRSLHDYIAGTVVIRTNELPT
jgi:uncharacterized RDD family membrane protein YckC